MIVLAIETTSLNINDLDLGQLASYPPGRSGCAEMDTDIPSGNEPGFSLTKLSLHNRPNIDKMPLPPSCHGNDPKNKLKVGRQSSGGILSPPGCRAFLMMDF